MFVIQSLSFGHITAFKNGTVQFLDFMVILVPQVLESLQYLTTLFNDDTTLLQFFSLENFGPYT